MRKMQSHNLWTEWERNVDEKIELVPRMIVHSAHALDLISFHRWIVYALAQFFILHKARSRSPGKLEKMLSGGEAISDPVPAQFTGSYSSTRRVESSAIVQNRGIPTWASSKKIKTPRRRRQSCPAGWSSPLATLPLCATRLVPENIFQSIKLRYESTKLLFVKIPNF